MSKGWQALVRGLRQGLGLAVEPVDYSPEAQLARLAERFEERVRLAEEREAPFGLGAYAAMMDPDFDARAAEGVDDDGHEADPE